MKELKSVLVGIDFSESSVAALIEASRLCQRDGAELHIVHAISAEFVERYRDSYGSPKSEILDKIRSQLSSFVTANLPAGSTFSAEVFVGSPFEEIVRAAENCSSDLVVLGSHGLTVAASSVGNIASKCVRKLPAPVLLVRDSHRGAFKTVVVGIDLSDASGLALNQAAIIAARDGAKMHVVHIHCPPWLWLSTSVYGLRSFPRKDYEDEYRRTLSDHVSSFLDPIRNRFPELEIETAIIENEATAHAIRDYLHESKADLAVIGSHGRAGFKSLFLGTTAERMINESPCSVLTVKAKKS